MDTQVIKLVRLLRNGESAALQTSWGKILLIFRKLIINEALTIVTAQTVNCHKLDLQFR